jgi:hypothetical protein
MENPYQAPCESPQAAGNRDASGHGNTTRWKLARQFAGWGLLALGVAGLILPILPGWFFLAWGAVILAPDVPLFSRLLDRVAHRVPQLRAAIEKARGKPEN